MLTGRLFSSGLSSDTGFFRWALLKGAISPLRLLGELVNVVPEVSAAFAERPLVYPLGDPCLVLSDMGGDEGMIEAPISLAAS